MDGMTVVYVVFCDTRKKTINKQRTGTENSNATITQSLLNSPSSPSGNPAPSSSIFFGVFSSDQKMNPHLNLEENMKLASVLQPSKPVSCTQAYLLLLWLLGSHSFLSDGSRKLCFLTVLSCFLVSLVSNY